MKHSLEVEENILNKEVLDLLSPRLSERILTLRRGVRKGKYVLYWMKHAARVEDNPALDVCLQLGKELSLPILVFQQISEGDAYASERRAIFELEGARDVQKQLLNTSISYIFHIQKRSEPMVLTEVISDAAIVVSEWMPVPSEKKEKGEVFRTTAAPILLVDTACLVPMLTVGRAYERAYAFREATASERKHRLKVKYPNVGMNCLPMPSSQIPLDDICLSNINFEQLVNNLDVDHSVKPVPGTTGGTQAGHERWTNFLEKKISHYARDRNNPILNPSSRMSAYLRLGQVSPFRLAREAAALNHGGAQKFLDELLIWRELAYCFCAFTEKLETLAALPEWARTSLLKHEEDERRRVFSEEELFWASSNNSLWNAAQTSLLEIGELHNNLRMTWGKAFLQWSDTVQCALTRALNLNNRLALDGNDPSSWGGILWCFGLFDRPFEPEQPIYGTVRSRPLQEHANRLHSDQFLKFIHDTKL